MKNLRTLFLVLLCACLVLGHAAAYAQVPAPSLTLKEAIDVADQTFAGTKADISKYYIYSVVYTNSSKGTCWNFIYKTIKPTVGQEINIRVYMNEEVEFSGGYFIRRGY